MMEVVSGDNWSYKTCKAPVKLSPPKNQHPTFYRPDGLLVTQSTVWKHLKGKYIARSVTPKCILDSEQVDGFNRR